MQDPSNSTANSSRNAHKPSPLSFGPSRAAHHHRAHSDISFRLPDDLDLVSDPFDAPPADGGGDFNNVAGGGGVAAERSGEGEKNAIHSLEY
ncbi:hypothetical protein Vadar_021207 [Vaccinium darrowii]|uniref:Uncharacterized protein n=1 Tax=Vaccinium darrowii TaxID=229202 RepID=A0ACB7XRY6_9ERIC|nr:hypothetical protein Vadar_021207 [Vaccinium darrowii]